MPREVSLVLDRNRVEESNAGDADGMVAALELVITPTIFGFLGYLLDGALGTSPVFTVGFAAETENVREYALGKLEHKKLDMIVANRVGEECGFDSDENTVDVYWDGGERIFETAEKTGLAREIVILVAERYELANTKVGVCDASN